MNLNWGLCVSISVSLNQRRRDSAPGQGRVEQHQGAWHHRCWHHPGPRHVLYRDEQPVNSSSYEIRAENLFWKKFSLSRWSTPAAAVTGLGEILVYCRQRNLCLAWTEQQPPVLRVLPWARATCGSPLSSSESGPFHRHPSQSWWFLNPRQGVTMQGSVVGITGTVTRETWKLKCVSLRLRCVYTHGR